MRSPLSSMAACCRPSICSPICRSASWRSSSALSPRNEGSVSQSTSEPASSPCSASPRSVCSQFSSCTAQARPSRHSPAKTVAGQPKHQSDSREQLMKLYHSTSSPNSRRVRMFIAEKGISAPLQSVNLGVKEQFSDWFKAVNPLQQVPVLVLDDGTAVE